MGVKFYTNIIPSHMWWECERIVLLADSEMNFLKLKAQIAQFFGNDPYIFSKNSSDTFKTEMF